MMGGGSLNSELSHRRRLQGLGVGVGGLGFRDAGTRDYEGFRV